MVQLYVVDMKLKLLSVNTMSKVISIDLELNPVSKKIIQLGYVIGDLYDGRIFTRNCINVNPNEELQVIPGLLTHITDYTGITQQDVDNAGTLPEAYRTMCADISSYNPTVSPVQWGQGDSRALKAELGLDWDSYIFRPREWDAKSFYQIYRAFQRKAVAAGLQKALESLDMKFEGRPHNALDDAYNTFLILRKLGMKTVGFDKIEKVIK